MRPTLFSVLFVILLATPMLGQSGRRLPGDPAPTPSPSVRSTNSAGYSESQPRPGRKARFPDRFPGISSGTAPRIVPPAVKQAGAPPSDDGDTLKVETNLITIPVSVYDRNGLYISGLKEQDFTIFEDGQEQEIAYFGTTEKPVTVALLLDTSPSTAYRIDEIHRAAEAFVEQLGPDDSVIVIEFNSSVKVQTKLTKDRELIRKGIYKAKFGDGTSLYNAVDEALRKQLGTITGRKAVVLFTDGVDTTSRKNNYDGTLNYAEESDSLVFPIYYNTYSETKARTQGQSYPDIWGGTTIVAGVSAEEYALGRRYLQELADATGGRIFVPDATPGGLNAAFEGIAEELRRQYNIGYVPKVEGTVGQRKQIKVRVARRNLVIRSRDSYVVGAAAATAPSLTPPAKSN